MAIFNFECWSGITKFSHSYSEILFTVVAYNLDLYVQLPEKTQHTYINKASILEVKSFALNLLRRRDFIDCAYICCVLQMSFRENTTLQRS